MTKQKRTYLPEFKREALQLWQTSDKSAATVETELGITPGLLYRWKKMQEKAGGQAFPGRGHVPADQEKVRLLEKENRILRQERDILKKAVAIFSNPKR